MNNFRKLKKSKRHFNAAQRKENKDNLIAYKQKGYGLYEYQNRLKATLDLPKLAADGKTKKIQPNEKFIGDDYFMFMVPGELRLIQVISPADEERRKEHEMENQKLLLDQPETVTSEGVVERVVVNDLPLNEDKTDEKKKDVLINENPLDGVKIIFG